MHIKKTKKWLLCSVFFLFPMLSQASSEKDSQFWSAMTATGPIFNNEYLYWLEGQARFGNDVQYLTQTFVRGAIGKRFAKNGSLWFGYALFYTGQPLSNPSTKESRLWQQHIWGTDFLNMKFTNRVRLEQRFLQTSAQVKWRFRESIKFQKDLPGKLHLYTVLMDEFFINLRGPNQNNFAIGLDQNRLFVGVGRHFNEQINVDMGYLNQNINRSGQANFIAHIFSINTSIKFT